MNEKYLKLNKQFENAVSQICQSPAEFNALLRVAAFNYRLTFQNAVLAYAQGTDSDLLLTYEQWQQYGRVAKRHTKATLLYDVNNRNRYVVTFPMSRTVVDKRIHRHKELRFFDYQNDAAVVTALQAVYQTDADNLAEILYAENYKRFESYFDDAYPAFDNEPDFLAKAVTNMLMCRFGEEMPYKSFSFSDGINRDNIEHIYQMVIDVFRAEYAEIVTSLPAELEKAREFTEDDDLPFDDVPVSTDSVTEIKQDVISLFKEKTNGLFHSIDGLSPSEIEQMVKEYAESVFSENEIYAEILGIAISGSRCRGLEHNGSDLDVVIEVQSDTKETALFNLLNERTFEIGGVRVDINPIKADETGTLSEYLPTVEKYLGKIEILDYGKYIIDNRSVFNAKKGSIYTIPIETTPALLRRLEKVGVVPRDEMTDVVFESDNGTWNKLIIPDRYGNKTNSIDISDVLSQGEVSVAQKVLNDAIEREQSIEKTKHIPFYTAVDTADNAVADTNSLSDKPTEKKISLPSEKPVVQLTQQDIDSLLILKPTVQNGKAEIYHAVQEEKPDSELIRLIREKYHGSGRNARSASGLLLQISDNSKGIFVAAYGNAYQPIIITYTQLLKRIRELAATNRYLTDSEFDDYAENYHLGDKAAVLKQLKFKYETSPVDS